MSEATPQHRGFLGPVGAAPQPPERAGFFSDKASLWGAEKPTVTGGFSPAGRSTAAGSDVPASDRNSPASAAVVDERRFPLKYNSLRIGTATVVMLVMLRVALGWHFLYEGVWKIKHPDEFAAELWGFLTNAKGPAAPLFYAMVPDLDGRRRLRVENKAGQGVVKGEVYLNAWEDLKQTFVDSYKPSEEQKAAAEELYKRYASSLKDYLSENQEDIIGYFGSLERFEKRRKGGNTGPLFQKQRQWNKQRDLRNEVNLWLSDLDAMGEQYRLALWDLLDEDQKAFGMLPPVVLETDKLPVSIPVVQSRMELLRLAITYGLTAIGLCLMLGLFTRLASLGGAAFLVSVLLTQPPWPTIYPPAPAVVGHALIVDKNFLEMLVLLMIATTSVGRWGGLDFFVHHWLVRPFISARGEADQQNQ